MRLKTTIKNCVRFNRPSFALTLALVGAASVPQAALAIDVSPGAYVPAPAGSKVAMLYLGGGRADANNPRRGKSIKHDTKLETQSALLRLFYLDDIADMRVQYQVAIPYGSQDLKLNGNNVGETKGLADPFVGVTVWPLNDPQNRRYLGLTGYLYLPLGRYHHNASLNMGTNRYAAAFQAGYAESWGAWRLDVNADVSFYSDNNDTGPQKRKTEQDPTYVLQPWLSYTFPNKLTTSVGVTRTWGGRSELDGVDTNRATDSTRVRAGVGYWVAPKTQLYLEMARDVEVNGGYKFDHTGFVRLTQLF